MKRVQRVVDGGALGATVGLTSNRPADPADAVHALMDDAFCDR
ncbi:hypothetical protein ACFVTT_03740 [Streptomyces niveus]